MAGVEEFRAVRSYLATTARHGIGALDALISVFRGKPWNPETGQAGPVPQCGPARARIGIYLCRGRFRLPRHGAWRVPAGLRRPGGRGGWGARERW